MPSKWIWIIPDPAPQERADRALLAALCDGDGEWQGFRPESFTRSQVQRWLEAGMILQDGVAIRAGTPLGSSKKITLELPDPAPLELTPQDIPIEILFQDEHVVVVNKPPGLTVHPSETQRESTLVHALLFHVKDLSGIGGALRPGIVHRIDKDTSGVIVITKTDLAHQNLSKQFADHSIDRRYWALCYGSLTHKLPAADRAKEIRVQNLLGRSPTDRKKIAVLKDDREGREAISYFKQLLEFMQPNQNPFASWVEAKLETGRTHQVRVHLTELGHSIMGDPTYGTPTSGHTKWKAVPREIQALIAELPGQALHARSLAFTHPASGARLSFEAPPPAAYARLLEALKKFSY